MGSFGKAMDAEIVYRQALRGARSLKTLTFASVLKVRREKYI